MNIIDVFSLTQEQLNDPIEFGKFFLNELKTYPGKKIGFIGQPQSGTTVAMHYLNGSDQVKALGDIFTYYDPRGIADTFKTSLPLFEDLDAIVREQIPAWMDLFDQVPDNSGFTEVSVTVDTALMQTMVNKISQDVEESRKMLLWRSALNLFCLRDLRTVNENQETDSWSIFELPYFPVHYNESFDKLIVLERRPNWFSDPAFLAHIGTEGVTEEAERNLVNMRDAELADYQLAGDWVVDYTIKNTGTVADLELKLLNTVTEIVGTL